MKVIEIAKEMSTTIFASETLPLFKEMINGKRRKEIQQVFY